MTYDTRKITHGTEEVTFTGATGDKVVFSTGVNRFAPSTKQDTKKIYADAATHMTLMNAKEVTIEIDNYQYNDGEYLQMGYTKVNGGQIDTGIHPTFDVQRLLTVRNEDGSTTKKLEVYYGCTSADYTESDDEDEDEINPKVYTRALTVAGKGFGNYGHATKFVVERTTENATLFDKYKTKVMTPDDFKATNKG